MKNLNNLFFCFFIVLISAISCEKNKEEISDLDKLRNSTNQKSYPATKMDSAQAIQFITKQKIQELLDLSALYTSGNQDTEIDSVIYTQMQNYFEKPDSTKLFPILRELDTLNVKSIKVSNIEIFDKIFHKDTLNFAKYHVEYFDKNSKLIGNFQRNAQYTLKPNPVKFKKEFKFYFVDFAPVLKDSISSGVTK